MTDELRRIEELAEYLVEADLSLMQDLVALRHKRGLSQIAVGERMGVSQPAVASFEAYDSNPTLSSIRRYALAVGGQITHSVKDDLEITHEATLGISQTERWLAQKAQLDGVTFSRPNVVTNA